MFKFTLRKMLSKKWMVLSLLIGNILLISIASSNPMYMKAVLQRTLMQNLQAYLVENNAYPGTASLALDSFSSTPELYARYDAAAQGMAEKFGVDVINQFTCKRGVTAKAELEEARADAENLRVGISMMSGMEDHIGLIAGTVYSAEPDADGVYDAIVSERGLMKMRLLLGDVVTVPRLVLEDGSPLKIRIAGVFRNASAEDIYWVRPPSYYQDDCFVHPDLFARVFLEPEKPPLAMESAWYIQLDYTTLRSEDVSRVAAAAGEYAGMFNEVTRKNYTDNFSGILNDYIKVSRKVTITLWVLQVPIFILLAAFIFMVSRQMLEMEKNEISVIKSRGAGRMQIFSLYLMQSVIVSLIAFAAGVPLGAFLCQVLGSSNAFLEFVRRSALPIEISGEVFAFAAGASMFSICAMVLPAMKYSKVGIVDHKRRKNRKSETPLWQKLGLDIIILGVALYGLYTFNGQRDILAARVQDGASLDPLLFLSSSMFMIGAGLFAVRVAPAIVWMIYRPFRGVWSPALYASFLRVLRTRSSQGFIMVFLIMTIALGTFNAQAARTINQNSEDNLRYVTGADVVLQEKWSSNAGQAAENPSAKLVYREPDFGRYEALVGNGAASVAKVLVEEAAMVQMGESLIKNVTLMGIHTRDFGRTAWFKDSLSDVHWYHYLNTMSQNSQAVLVSANFRAVYGCGLGDSFTYRLENGENIRGVICGFVDYFPGFVPVSYVLGDDGLYTEQENFLVVGHLSQIQSVRGVTPYQIWIRNEDSSAYLYEFAQENGIRYEQFLDADAQVVAMKNDPVLQGTNGILTVGFIVVLLLCSVGFLIYWILSIQSRSLQFGIFRAMGMSMREVLTMLINEQVFISGLSIAVGALVGHLTAKLYMPLIQLAYAASDSAVPLEVISLQSDSVRLFSVVGAVMLVCMFILGALVSRMKIAQALKLGED